MHSTNGDQFSNDSSALMKNYIFFIIFLDTSADSSSGIVLPNGRGQPRKKARHVTEQDIESLERAQANARKKLKNILDKATEDAKELVKSQGLWYWYLYFGFWFSIKLFKKYFGQKIVLQLFLI